MGTSLTYTIDDKKLRADLKKLRHWLGESVKQDVITKSLLQGAQHLAKWSKKYRLSGPRPQYLGVKSGNLRASVAASVTTSAKNKNEYEGRVGTNLKYAPIHEYGYYGMVTVRAHIRRSFGKVRLFGRTKKLTTNRGWVDSFQRQMRMPARPFLRPALQEPSNIHEVLNLLTENINAALRKK